MRRELIYLQLRQCAVCRFGQEGQGWTKDAPIYCRFWDRWMKKNEGCENHEF
jgi:hypothetical protein